MTKYYKKINFGTNGTRAICVRVVVRTHTWQSPLELTYKPIGTKSHFVQVVKPPVCYATKCTILYRSANLYLIISQSTFFNHLVIIINRHFFALSRVNPTGMLMHTLDNLNAYLANQ